MNLKKKLKEMDKAITREDMINAARKLYKGGWWESERLDAVLEEMFPELKESEDERIRKCMVDYFKHIDKAWISEEFTSWQVLAWLEKQKENPKTANSIPSNCASDAKCDIPDDYPIGFPFDSEVMNVMCDAAQGYRSWKNPQDVKFCSDKLLAIVYDGLVGQKEQKPAEWSEEDEEILDRLQRLIIICRGEMKFIKQEDFDKLDNWLKSLRTQPNQAWSEKEQEYLDSIIHNIEATKETVKTVESKDYCDKLISFLKSLKNRGNYPKSNTNSPHWKPSEEQLDALLASYSDEGVYDYDALQSLYNDLIKL